MAMVDLDFYRNKYFGEEMPTAIDFDRLEMRAEEMVNEYSNHFFDTNTIDELPLPADVLNVKKAVCAQIEWFIDAGGVEELANAKQAASGVSHVTVGKFSYNKATPVSLSRSTAQRSNAAINYLRPTGLLYRGVSQHG